MIGRILLVRMLFLFSEVGENRFCRCHENFVVYLACTLLRYPLPRFSLS